jgi:excisionase family DNA binding protein
MGATTKRRNRGGRPKRVKLEQRMYTISDIADLIGCSRVKVALMVRDGTFKTARLVGRLWLISIDEVNTLCPPLRRG